MFFLCLAVQGRSPEDARPFFTDSCKGTSEQSHGVVDLNSDALVGVPTHYQYNGTYAYMLTPTVSPPSTDSVLEWLALEEKGRAKNDLPSIHSYTSISLFCFQNGNMFRLRDEDIK